MNGFSQEKWYFPVLTALLLNKKWVLYTSLQICNIEHMQAYLNKPKIRYALLKLSLSFANVCNTLLSKQPHNLRFMHETWQWSPLE